MVEPHEKIRGAKNQAFTKFEGRGWPHIPLFYAKTNNQKAIVDPTHLSLFIIVVLYSKFHHIHVYIFSHNFSGILLFYIRKSLSCINKFNDLNFILYLF